MLKKYAISVLIAVRMLLREGKSLPLQQGKEVQEIIFK
jgi:hypothetical protein